VLAVSPDGARLWADGLDACHSPRYDHRGCYLVPGGIVNILDTRMHDVAHQIGFPGNRQTWDIVFSRGGRYVVLTGKTLLVLDAHSYRVVASAPDSQSDQAVITEDGRLYVTETSRNRVVVYQINGLRGTD
jgi:DNA-binding beta-propeller fold protein YncE